jgi:hypothetical protein
MMSKGKWIVALAVVVLASAVAANTASARIDFTWDTPKLPPGMTVTIDGDASEWMDYAYTDGVWDWDRISSQPWFNPEGVVKAPSATGPDEGEEAGTADDFSFEGWVAWDDEGIVIAVSAIDNIWDVHSIGDSGSFANSDVVSVFTDSKGGFGNVRTPGYASWWWRAHPGEGATWRRIIEGLPDDKSQGLSGEQIPESIGETIVDPVGASPNALGGDWMFEGRMRWEYWTARDENWAPPYEGREMGFAWLIIDADGAKLDGLYYVGGSNASADPEEASWTTFAPGEVAVESSSWGDVKQLFK